MPGSRKGVDVRRDPRLTLHNATIDKDAASGDATISGRAVEVTDEDTRRTYTVDFQARQRSGGAHPLRPVPGGTRTGVDADARW